MAKKKKPARKRNRKTKTPDWKQFELAVAAFVAAQDPSAKVTHNATIPDADTGTPRQHDVWVETAFGQFYPLKILISCKRYRSKLNIKHVGDFLQEIDDARANKGIIYSFTGFTKTAIAKAKKHNVCCCRLYQNQPADLPESLILREAYLCRAEPILRITDNIVDLGFIKWSDVFSVTANGSHGQENVKQHLIRVWNEGQDKENLRRMTTPGNQIEFPKDWGVRFAVHQDDQSVFEITLECHYVYYRGKSEATLLNGSYSITSNVFHGTQFGPVVDLKQFPGPAWERIDATPTELEGSGMNTVLATEIAKYLDVIADWLLPQLQKPPKAPPTEPT